MAKLLTPTDPQSRRLIADFSRIYRECVEEIIRRLPEDWAAFSKHNVGWRKEVFNFRQYLSFSETRYVRALHVLLSDSSRRILDVGGFLAAFPLALRRLGLEVSIAEKYGYYDNALDVIVEHLLSQGVQVLDLDFTEPQSKLDGLAQTFDAVTCMAVAEHLAHSPRALMENLHTVLKPGGTLVFEVPNLAFWPRRVAFFFHGRTVLAPIEHVYHSAVPFTGHHREYTLADAHYVVREGGFEVVADYMFNYSVDGQGLLHRLKHAPAILFREYAEIILLHCRKPVTNAFGET